MSLRDHYPFDAKYLSSPRVGGIAILLTVFIIWACVEPDLDSAAGSPTSTLTSTMLPMQEPGGVSTSQRGPTLFEQVDDHLRQVQAEQGTAAALAELERITAAQPEVNRFCHAIAHDLGHRALDAVNGSAARALQDRNDVCGGGYTHGVIERALGEAAHPRTAMLTLCAPANDGSCWHGIGHGLMFATGMDAQASTRLCDRAPTRLLASRCGEGVYMQVFSADLSAHHTGGDAEIAHDPERARQLCRQTRSAYAANCWFYAPVVWLTAHPDQFADGIAWCAGAGSSTAAQVCAKGIGSRSVKYHPDDLTIGARTCAEAGLYQDSCLRGMASYWSVHFKGSVPPADLCRHLAQGALRQRCESVA